MEKKPGMIAIGATNFHGHPDYLKLTSEAQKEVYKKGELAGIKKVVEWIEEQGYYSSCEPCECLTNRKKWQSKLKEWRAK